MKPIVFVFTSDKYIKSLQGFIYLFNKYWSNDQQVFIFGFTNPEFLLPPNFIFESLGSQDNYPVNRWSDAVINVIRDTDPNQRPIIMLEDYWLVRPVNIDVVNALYVYMRSTDNVLKMDLVTDRLYAQGMVDYGNIGFIDIIKSDPMSQYQMSLMTGMWNPELLLSVLRPGETPWDTEIDGTVRAGAMGDSAMVLGTRQFPVRHILANRGGDASNYILDGLLGSLRSEDIAELQEIGVL